VTETSTASTSAAGTAPRALRADAQRNIAAILDAATECLARDPDLSLNDVARAAGVGRVTLYAHFESRSGLVEAVVDRAMRHTDEVLGELDLSGDPVDAMATLMGATWDLTLRYGALVVAAQRALPAQRFHDLHEAPTVRVQQLLRRGRRQRVFRTDAPIAWQLTTIQAILHGASEAAYRGELNSADARRLVTSTILATLVA
jgi:AcrR family transcriptional regulator